MKQLTGPRGSETIHHPNPSPSRPAAELPLVTRFRDPEQPYEDLIMCERDCMRCSYAFTLDCDGNCGSCPRRSAARPGVRVMSSSRWWRPLEAIKDEALRLARLVADTAVRL